jgi:CDP-glycerol glycerophosphotransferase (TagB/SpsB family)
VKKVRYRRGARTRSHLWLPKAIARGTSTLIMALLDAVVPKKAGRVVLGSDKAVKYNGNPRFLFEHLAEQEGWEPYWLSVSPEILREVNARFPGRALHAWSFRALRMGLTAQWLGFSHSRYDLGYFAYLVKPRFIYLNHGVPLKTMGFDKAYDDPTIENAAAGMAALTCCSDFEAALWSRAYRLPLERIWVTGSPRNDRLFVNDDSRLQQLGTSPGQKILLFAPTYRETGLLQNYLPVPGLDPQELTRLLEAHNAVLLIRPHYYEWSAARDMVQSIGSDHVRLADEGTVPDVNELLPIVDVLITDYSSIFFDYLLLDRPIIFSCYDQGEYERERGFMINYNQNTPGAKVRTPGEFMTELEALLLGDDAFRDARTAMRQRFHRYPDGYSAGRVAKRMQQPGRSVAQPRDGQRLEQLGNASGG